jgi:hypothetical protein
MEQRFWDSIREGLEGKNILSPPPSQGIEVAFKW